MNTKFVFIYHQPEVYQLDIHTEDGLLLFSQYFRLRPPFSVRLEPIFRHLPNYFLYLDIDSPIDTNKVWYKFMVIDTDGEFITSLTLMDFLFIICHSSPNGIIYLNQDVAYNILHSIISNSTSVTCLLTNKLC